MIHNTERVANDIEKDTTRFAEGGKSLEESVINEIRAEYVDDPERLILVRRQAEESTAPCPKTGYWFNFNQQKDYMYVA